MAEFDIYALSVGTGSLAVCPLPGREGDYVGDLARVVAWGPDLVVSMTLLSEMGAAGGLANDLEALGIAWRHLPVEDYGIPDATATASVADIMVLANGQRALIHCYGGCGRSGMLALRLMIHAREPAAAALKRLRAVRPCAVETDEQLRWAMA